MKKLIFKRLTVFALFIFSIAASVSYGYTPTILIFSASSASPNYYEVNLPNIGSKLYVNTKLAGKVVVARDINTEGSIGNKYSFNFIQINENWAEIEFENPVMNFNEIILLGTKGNILIKKSLPGQDILVYKNGTSSGWLVSRLGVINDTIYFPDSEMMDIDSIGIGILKKDGEKLKGDILVATDRSIAFQFNGTNSTYTDNGISKVVIRLRSKSLLVNLKSWGYLFDVERIDNKKMNLIADVYGLNPDSQLHVEYEAYEGQVIEPFATTFTVRDINNGRPIASIQDDNKPIKFELVLPE